MAAPPAPFVGRSAHTAVWTGTEMLVFGGQNAFVGASRLDTGARYAPATDTWRAMATAGARARARHTAVWTGRVMLVLGGRPNDSDSAGEAYDPATDTWTSIASEGAPGARTSGHSAVWTGTEMIVWGGLSATSMRLNTGARYDPARNRWTPMSTVGAPSPRNAHVAVWTGTEMLVWGGGSTSTLSDGAAYDPARDVWRPLTQTGAPSARLGASAEWTGTEMIVWGGGGGADLGGVERRDGGRYDPMRDAWTLFATPMSRSVKLNASVWTGAEMIVWGGSTGANPEVYLAEGAAYAPEVGRLTLLPTEGAPSRRTSPTAVWTGVEMLVWGGYQGTSVATNGARYRR
jgi:N-acetylneuraminic acid mutarotase